jgi:hypothetical protein
VQTALAAVTRGVAGCATSSGVLVNPSAQKMEYRSAYVVTHGDKSSDMDALIQKELLRDGMSVSAGPEGSQPADTQIIVRYIDDWKWDMAMYLRSLDFMFVDPASKTVLATGSWKNSAFHGFYSADKVVAQVVDDTLKNLRGH